MVYLNRKLPIDIEQMKKIVINEIDEIIEHKLYFLDVIFPTLKNELKKDEKIYNDKIKKLKNDIVKEFKIKINSDYLIYKIIHEEHCIFKHERGKNNGNFCCKRITKNGDKKKYVCTMHNKNHTPKKKIKLIEDKIEGNTKNIIPNLCKINSSNNEIILENSEINYKENLNNNIELLSINKKLEDSKKIRKYMKNSGINKNKKILKFNSINYLNNKININKIKKIYNYDCQPIIYNTFTLLDFIPNNILSY